MVLVFLNSNLQIDAFDNFLNVFHAQVFSCNVFEMFTQDIQNAILFNGINKTYAMVFTEVIQFFTLDNILGFYRVSEAYQQFVTVETRNGRSCMDTIFRTARFTIGIHMLVVGCVTRFSFSSFVFCFTYIYQILRLNLILSRFSDIERTDIE